MASLSSLCSTMRQMSLTVRSISSVRHYIGTCNNLIPKHFNLKIEQSAVQNVEQKFGSTLCNNPSIGLSNIIQSRNFSVCSPSNAASLNSMHKRGIRPRRKKKNPLGFGIPKAKGVVLKVFSKKPKKPNSANRKCVLLRLSTGKEMVAYVPGEGHTLQEHNVVLVRVGRLRDVPGVKLKCIRGEYDLGHVVRKTRV